MNQFSPLPSIFLYCVCCLAVLSCSNKVADADQAADADADNGFKVIDSASQYKQNYRTLYFASDGIEARQLQHMQQASGFELQIRQRDIQGFVFVEILQADELDAEELQQGLDRINDLPFISNARFEPLAKAVSE